jgi:predicted AlkP superfamily phosphohydrolase/phosphomutase
MSLLPAAGLAAALSYALDQWLPYSLPFARTRRQGRTLWDVTTGAGLKTVVLKFPLTFPVSESPELRMLAGVGVPDLSGTAYSWTCFDPASDARETTETYGSIRPWKRDGEDLVGRVRGPRNPLAEKETADVEVRFRSPNRLSIGDAPVQELSEKKWSRPFRISIRFSPLLALRAQVRACLLGFKGDGPRVLVGPLQFDPRDLPPNAEITQPRAYAGELAGAVGGFPTLGWAIATHPAKDGCLDDEAFLDDCLYHFDREADVFRLELARDDWHLLNAVFMATDRAQHILWRHLDREHPLHDPEAAAEGVRRLREVFVRMDAIVGQAMARAKEIGAEVMVLSDHGFAPFNDQVHLNTALRKAGLLKLREPSLPADAHQALSGENLNRIDFAATQAYALGLGGVYLNLKGRERYGVVDEAERDLVTRIVIGVLKKIRDPRGRPVVRRVLRNEDVYAGPHAADLPDLLVCFEPGHRVSWATVVGGAPEGDVVVPNRSAWSGDHCSVDPERIPGVLFCSRQLRDDAGTPGLLDYAPSILGLMGAGDLADEAWEGKPVFV